MAKLDPIATLQVAGIVAAGVVAYLVVTKIAKTGAKVGEAVASVAADVKETVVNTVTKTLNPASSENVVNSVVTSTPIGQDMSEKLGNWLGSVFDPKGYAQYQENLKKLATVNGGASNVKAQADVVRPSKKMPFTGPMPAGDPSYNLPLTFTSGASGFF
jgi:hypothetical protein